MKCPQCFTEHDVSAQKCSACEHVFAPLRVKSVGYMSFYAEYFSFRELVTPQLIKVVYIVGACFITAVGLLSTLSPEGLERYAVVPIFSRLGGIAVLLVGNLVWRMMCEGAILLFSLHELLVSIDTQAKALRLQGKSGRP